MRPLWFCLIAISCVSCATPPAPKPSERDQVLAVMERVADWQLAHPGKHRKTDWTQGALYAGMMALDEISPSPRFR